MLNTLTDPPCSRYEGGEDNRRCQDVWLFALGLLGGGASMNELRAKVARVHDHKGALIIATRRTLTSREMNAFRQAWSQIGYEPTANVEFYNAWSDQWESYWSARRFESAWKP